LSSESIRELGSLPGPKGLPVLGNALQIRPAVFHRQLEDWVAEYGPAYRIAIGSRQYLCTADPEHIDSVLRRRPDVFRRAERLEQIAQDIGFVGVFSASGGTWRRQRQMVMAGLDPRHIRNFLPALVDVTERLQRRWLAAAQAGRDLDLLDELMRYTVDVTTSLAFGKNLNTIEEGDSALIQRHLNVIFPTIMRRLLAPVDFDHYLGNWRIAGHLRELRQAVDGFIATARRELEQDPALRERPRNLLHALLVARDRPDSGLTDEDVSGNVFTMLLAGEDTTAYTIAWMLWFLQRHPDTLRQAQAEVDSALAGARLATSMEQLAGMDYLQACAYEAMRLKPVAPLIINEAVEDTVVGDIRIPRNAQVMCIMRPTVLDPARVEQPTAFDPARWLDPQAQAAHFKRASMPFGSGPRTCPGRFLALVEIKLLASMLLANFDLEEVGSQNGAEPAEKLSFVMAPEAMRMRLRPKARASAARQSAAAEAVQS